MLASMDGQEYSHVHCGWKKINMDHPVSYVSGLFCGSQLNWVALTKEAYAIYMSVKKSTFYLQDMKSPREVIIWHSRNS